MRKVAGRLRLDLAQYRELEAFAQFGSELDQATQQSLARGERMVATLNQPQYQPWPVEEQVVAIYAGINGYLDDVPVDQVPRFQEELREHAPRRGHGLRGDPRAGRRSPTRRTRSSTRSSRRFSRASTSSEDAWSLRRAIAARGSTYRWYVAVQDIRRRIRSVANTRKITRAMELVAAAKLREAQARIEAMRPFADRMLELMAGTGRASTSVRGCRCSSSGRRSVRSHSSRSRGDRGLAGAFNSQVLRRALALERELRGEGKQVRWVGVGQKGVGSLRFRRFDLAGEFTGFTDQPAYANAQAIAHRLAELYTDEEVDRVMIVYNTFESALDAARDRAGRAAAVRGLLETDEQEREEDAMRGDFIFEPEPEEILERLLPVYLETELYRALLESTASEHGARMTAMRNASKNAGELIDDLTLR